jgi:HlyD family secretion protein
MPGMTTANRIITDQRNDVIRVPNQALRYRPGGLAGQNKSGQAQIWVLRNEQPVSVPVTTGLDDDNFTEIVSGDLKPGDLVITAEQVATDNNTAAPRLPF